MTKNRITKAWLKNHFSYGWWKYLLVCVACVFAIDMLFTITAYRPPESRKIEVYVLNHYADVESMREELEPIFFERFPEQEELTVLNINLSSDDMYARMQFSTYLAAKQGDVYLLPAIEFQSMTAEGTDAFVDLTPYIESGVIDAAGMDLSGGKIRHEDGTQGVYAIAADTLVGLERHGNDPEGAVLCMTSFGGNEAHAAQVLNLLIEQYAEKEP